ncbi:MAG: DUF3336 domain-containing protein [Bacteroidota bacterium]
MKFNRKSATTDVNSYEEWKQKAIEQDRMSGMYAWKQVNYSNLYDNDEIHSRLMTLRAYREKGDDEGLLFTLNEGIHGNMGGIGNAKLYEKAEFGTKQLIVDYIEEVSSALLQLADRRNTNISFEDKIDFFQRASICFGRSALMLSGGAQLGNFHGGVIKALVKENLLPSVISGSSAGSMFAALAGTYSDEALIEFFKEETLNEELAKEARIFESIASQKKSVGIKELESAVNTLIPDLTFQEAYQLTGRKINISIAPHKALQKSRLLNAIASPNVLIRSAVMASCAIPGVFPPVTLFAKNKDGRVQAYLPSRKWVDGSLSNDLPAKRLARMYGVNHFIVSLTNPIILPFVNSKLNQSELISPFLRFNKSIIKEVSNFNHSIVQSLFKRVPAVSYLSNSINSIVQQDYTGDINIVADFSTVKPTKLLTSLTRDELLELLNKGEKATWPKIEMIRLTTKVGRILDQILLDYEQEELRLAKRGLGSPSKN